MVLMSRAPHRSIEFGRPTTNSTINDDDDEPKHRPKRVISFYILYLMCLPFATFLYGLKLGGRNSKDHRTLLSNTVDNPSSSSSSITSGGIVIPKNDDGGTTIKSCSTILDELDDTFNQRRQPRQARKTGGGWTGLRLFDLYEPEANCFSEERFGSESNKRYDAYGDGPKFVCGVNYLASKAKGTTTTTSMKDDNHPPHPPPTILSPPSCLVYSIGSNNDIRFEKAVHTHMGGGNCEVHTFDPTLDDTAFIGADYATFHSWGLGTDGGREGQTMHGRRNTGSRKSFETVMRDLGHVNRTIDILKIDCQGCEYAAMPPLFELIAIGKANVNQILIELHDPKTDRSADQLYEFFLAADRAKFRITHKERNHWGCAGARCVEYALTSESFLRDVNGAIVCSAPITD